MHAKRQPLKSSQNPVSLAFVWACVIENENQTRIHENQRTRYRAIDLSLKRDLRAFLLLCSDGPAKMKSPPCPSPSAQSEKCKESCDCLRQSPVPVVYGKHFLHGRGGHARLSLTSHNAIIFFRIEVMLLFVVGRRFPVPPVSLAFRIVVVLPPLVREFENSTAACRRRPEA